MKRISRLVLVMPLIVAAAPTHRGALSVPHQRGPLPVPPIPPAHRPTDGAAPTPNVDVAAPPVQTSDGLTITPTIVRAPTFHNSYDPSLGYADGSRWQDDPSAERRLTPSPGFNVQIPFK
jgi:hypothetical protein